MSTMTTATVTADAWTEIEVTDSLTLQNQTESTVRVHVGSVEPVAADAPGLTLAARDVLDLTDFDAGDSVYLRQIYGPAASRVLVWA